MKKLPILFLLLTAAICLQGQVLSSISSRWSDSFVEWEIYALPAPDSVALADGEAAEEQPEEELLGELKLRWLHVKDDFSEWDYSLGDSERGTIRLKWKNDPTQWELRTYEGAVVTMRASWANDLTEWRVTDNAATLTFKSRWTNTHDEWLAQDSKLGTFYVYTLRQRDPRDWAIEDKMDASISRPMKLAMAFLAIFHTSPRQ